MLAALWRTSFQAAVLVLLVLLVQFVFQKHLTARWRSALWLVVIVRLLVPFAPGSVLSVFNLFPHLRQPVALAESITPTDAAMADNTAERPVVLAVPRIAPMIVLAPPAKAAEVLVAQSIPRETHQPSAAAPEAPAQAAATPRQPISWVTLLLSAWVIGVAGLGGYVLACSTRLARMSRRLRVINDEQVLATLDDAAERMGVRRRLTVVENPDLASPALFGFLRPRLMLPKGFLTQFSRQELRFVFLHEMAHLRRHDLALNGVVTLLQVLHWFNPLVWLGFARWRADRELACDALALEAAGDDQQQAYGRTILHLLENFTHRTSVPGLVGVLEDKSQLRRRIGMIASFRPGKRLGLFSLALIAIVALVGLTDAQPIKSAGSKKAASTSETKTASNEPQSVPNREKRVGEDPVSSTGSGTNVRTLKVLVQDEQGKPIAGARIDAPYMGMRTISGVERLTDNNGSYLLRFPIPEAQHRRQASNFSVSAQHGNSARRSVMWTSSSGDVYGGMPESVVIKLRPGVKVGGTVLDDQGRPIPNAGVLLSGSGYGGFTIGNTERRTHEYSDVWETEPKRPAAVTDANGRWVFDRFPDDLRTVEVTFVRPDDSRVSFTTGADHPLNDWPKISITDLLEQKLVVRLPEGLTVRGMVVDENNKPLAGVKVLDGYGHGNIVRVSEFETDAKGRFERTHRAPRQWIYTASREDRATTSVIAQVEPGMPEVRIAMPPAKPWIARILDSKRKPIPGAEVTLDRYRTGPQIIDWNGKTDDEGRVTWANAPLSNVVLYVSASGTGRKIRISREAGEQQIVLDPLSDKVKVAIQATDAVTGEKVRLESVTANFEGGGSPYKTISLDEQNQAVTIQRTDFRVGMYPSYRLRLEVKGYETLTTDAIDFDYGDQKLTPRLQPFKGARQVTVLQPDGAPAVEAHLWASQGYNATGLYIQAPGRYYGREMLQAVADEQGSIKLPGAADSAPVVITHGSGILATTMASLRTNTQVRLKDFGTLEGRLVMAGKPRKGVMVSLHTLSYSPTRGFSVGYSVSTGDDGRFSFTKVPPGNYRLAQWGLPKRRDTSGMPITETRQMYVTVLENKTNVVEYAHAGRLVTGRAVPLKQDLEVDWENNVHTLTLKVPTAKAATVNREDYATFEAFIEAHQAMAQTKYKLEEEQKALTYALDFEADGSFRIEDVRPGTYQLSLRVTKPGERNSQTMFRQGEELGSLAREIVVPEGNGSLDLGTLAIDLKEGAPSQKPAPLSLTATGLDGKPLTLASFKGKHILLVFWAGWSQRSKEQFETLGNLVPKYASDGRLEIVAVNIDESLELAREAVKAGKYPWQQAWMDAPTRSKAAESFQIETLPALFLLDPEGRPLAANASEDRLETALKRALGAK